MRLQLTVTHRVPSPTGTRAVSSVDVEVDAPSGSTAAALVDALAEELGLARASATTGRATPEPLALVVGGTVVEPHAPVGMPPLLDGAAVSLRVHNPLQDNETRANRSRRTSTILAVIHGPDCGRSVDIPHGHHTLGRSGEADHAIDDPSLSRLHAEVCVDADGVTLRDLCSTNGTRVDGQPITGVPVPITAASTIRLGDSIVALRHPGAVPAATTVTGEGTVAVNRRPRVPEASPPVTLTLPTPPTAPRRTRIPWVAVLLPIPVAAVLAVVVGPTMLAFALMGPVLMVGSSLSDRWGTRRTYAADLVAHHAALRLMQERTAAACRDEARALVRSWPDPATISGIASGPTERLWERRRGDDDALALVVGRCRRDASVLLVGPTGSDVPHRPQLEDAPCTLSLTDIGVLGLCGDREQVAASARQLVGQLVTMHSPADLQVVALVRDDEAAERWSWLMRVPHSRNALGPNQMARTATLDHDEAGCLATVTALATAVRDRVTAQRSVPWRGPTTLVVVDGAAAFRHLPDLATVLADGRRVGVVCLAIDTDRNALPHEAGAVLDLPNDATPTLALPGHRHTDLVVDGVGPSWSERLSRSLAPLRDATPSDGPAALPGTTGLLACGSPLGDWQDDTGPGSCGSADVRAATMLARTWEQRPHRTSVPIGVCSTGTFSIDLAGDGPHVLVGGTTGAGKSELLRTLVASLAMHNTPQHLSFVLVDYKGGAAFRECADLPHVAGVVTDLDDHLAARALTSLTAELTRRERVLRDAGVTDFVSYQSSPAGVSAPLARLVVVVDEFRALAEELPAFVDGLVRLASLGRSLGIHLVLATQRPAGVVTADIKANVNLRIALRMRDRIDSEDVVDSPAAAGVDPATPGRAHARTGGGPLVEFQAAHVGSALVAAGSGSIRIRRCTRGIPSGWPDRLADGDRTELGAIVGAVRRATDTGRLAPAPAAWLPPLPAHVPHASLGEPPDHSTVHLGLVDVPEQQRQEPLVLDLRGRGHWAVIGSPGSGRSTTLVTLARALCARRGPEQLHLYAVSGGSLATLGSLPQVGASVDWSETARLDRLITRLSAEVARRRAALALRGTAPIGDEPVRESRTGDTPLGGQGGGAAEEEAAPPTMLLLIDDWELAAGRHDDLTLASLVDRILAVLREGEAVGLTAVLAGDRSLLLGRAGSTVSRRVVLRLADPTDAVLLGLAPRQLASLRRPGHGLTAEGHQVQLALPPEPPCPGQAVPPNRPRTSDADQGREEAMTRGPSAQTARRPFRVDALPTSVREDQLGHDVMGQRTVALGIGGNDSAVLALDPARDGRRWLVTGPAGTGVSTALVLVATSLLGSGRPVAVVAHRPGPLDALRADADLVAWCDGSDTTPLVEARRREPALAVVVDTADELLDHPVEAVLREITHLVDHHDGLVVVGANSTALSSLYRGLAVEVARHHTGVLLGPTSTADSQAFGVRVPPEREARPGRGHVVRRGVATSVQMALPTPRPPRSPVIGGRGSVTA